MIFDKINILSIIGGHFETLKDEQTKSYDFFDILVFLIFPVALSVFLALVYSDLQPLIDILITSLTIFTGLLFNLLVLMYDIIKRRKDKEEKLNDEKLSKIDFNKQDQLIEIQVSGRFLKQLFNNISYSILISVFAIIFLVLSYLSDNNLFGLVNRFLIFFFCINFFVTLLMILKRTHKLILLK